MEKFQSCSIVFSVERFESDLIQPSQYPQTFTDKFESNVKHKKMSHMWNTKSSIDLVVFLEKHEVDHMVLSRLYWCVQGNNGENIIWADLKLN